MLNERARDVAWQAVYRARTVVCKLADDLKNRRGRMPSPETMKRLAHEAELLLFEVNNARRLATRLRGPDLSAVKGGRSSLNSLENDSPTKG
jgi:hypothetical protein